MGGEQEWMLEEPEETLVGVQEERTEPYVAATGESD